MSPSVTWMNNSIWHRGLLGGLNTLKNIKPLEDLLAHSEYYISYHDDGDGSLGP